MTEQATKGRHGLLAGNLVAGVTVSVNGDGFAGARELGGRRVCHRIDAPVEHIEATSEPAPAPHVPREPAPV
jgi:hypothetical protein